MSFKSGVEGRGSDRWWERRWWLWWGDMRRMRWSRWSRWSRPWIKLVTTYNTTQCAGIRRLRGLPNKYCRCMTKWPLRRMALPDNNTNITKTKAFPQVKCIWWLRVEWVENHFCSPRKSIHFRRKCARKTIFSRPSRLCYSVASVRLSVCLSVVCDVMYYG